MVYFLMGCAFGVLVYTAYSVRKAYKDVDDIVKSVDSLLKRERENANN